MRLDTSSVHSFACKPHLFFWFWASWLVIDPESVYHIFETHTAGRLDVEVTRGKDVSDRAL